MKSLKKKLKHERSHATPLIDETVGPRYNTMSTSESLFQEDSNKNNFEMQRSEMKRSQSSLSSQMPESPTRESEFYHSQKREHSWVTEARVQSAKEPVLDSDDARFSTVDICADETWLSGIWQSLIIIIVFLLTPSIIFALIGCSVLRCCILPNAGRSTRERKKVRYAFFLFLSGILFSLFKDCSIAMVIVFSVVKPNVPCYPVIYPITVFLVLIFCAVTPVMIYEFTGVSFNYGNEGKNEFQKKPTKSKEKQIATDFMNRHLSSIQEVTDFRYQVILLSRETSKLLLMGALIVLFILCGLRSFLYWIIHSPTLKDLNAKNNSSSGNITFENKTANSSSSFNLNDVVMGISSLNTFVMSFSLSIFFLSVFLWNLLSLKLWRKLLNTGNNPISQGVEGVTAWWRIYQTLDFLSSSPWNLFVFLRITTSVIFAILSIVLSAALISREARKTQFQEVSPMIIFDNFLLVFSLILAILNSFSMALVNRKLSQHLNHLRLCMTDLGVSLPIDNDRSEGEYQAHLKRFRARNIRSSLQLLQEVSNAINETKTRSFPSLVDVVYFAVAIFGLVSIGNWKSHS